MPHLPTVLLVDDNHSTNFLHTRILKKSGRVGHIEACTSAFLALEYLTTLGQNARFPKPDLIFLDINMPGMSGWEFLEAYRKLPEKQRGGIVIVMLTSSLNPDDLRRAEQFDEIAIYQQKPLRLEELNAILDQALVA